MSDSLWNYSHPTVRFSSRFALAVVIALAIGFVTGCDGTERYPSSPLEEDQTYTQEILGTVPINGHQAHPFVIVRSGTMTVQLNWVETNVNLNLYLTAATCTDLAAAGCQILASSLAASGTTETIIRPVTANQEVQVWVDNVSAAQALVNYQVSFAIE